MVERIPVLEADASPLEADGVLRKHTYNYREGGSNNLDLLVRFDSLPDRRCVISVPKISANNVTESAPGDITDSIKSALKAGEIPFKQLEVVG